MFLRTLLFFSFFISFTYLINAQTIDIIITKSGTNIYGEILENSDSKIEIKESLNGNVRKVLKSEIEEVLLGYKYEDLSASMRQELEVKRSDSDFILRTNGDRLNVIIVEVSDETIKYKYPFEGDDDVREIDRLLVEEYYQQNPVEKLSSKKEYQNTPDPIMESEQEKYVEEIIDLEENYMEEVVYTQNRMQLASFNFTAMGLGTLSFGYERAFGKNTGVEIVASIHGAGVQNKDVHKEGFGIEVGYKYKMGNIFSEYYLPDHLMSGTYIKPIIGFVSVNERTEIFFPNNAFTLQNKNRDYGYLGFDLGYQWVFGDLVSMDIYSGLAYYNGDFEITTNNSGEITKSNDNYFDEGDFFASDNFGAKAGFRIGILFGRKSKYQPE